MKTNQEFSRKKPQELQKELGKDEALVSLSRQNELAADERG